jgi:adenosylcobinamide kinase/adenosylcobinamide-phosphate guanylyltransferase
MGNLTFILGGARSGKSQFAMQLAQQKNQEVCYIATAEALDPEMEKRIAKHRINRPAHWKTIELNQNVAKQLQNNKTDADIILLDCITLLVSNILLKNCGDQENPDEAAVMDAIENEMTGLLSLISKSRANWIVVSNEVGLGLVPPYPLGRLYRDILGKVNQQFAQAAQESFFMIAGIPVPLHQLGHKD